jgi:hypothetical protein
LNFSTLFILLRFLKSKNSNNKYQVNVNYVCSS